MFKIGMFDIAKVEIYSNELITYEGHLPYYILSVLGRENIKKRNEYLRGISQERYDNERQVLKSERKSNNEKLESLLKFLKDNPQFQDIIQNQHLKPLLQ